VAANAENIRHFFLDQEIGDEIPAFHARHGVFLLFMSCLGCVVAAGAAQYCDRIGSFSTILQDYATAVLR
jgi:hypothetical protein